MFRLKLKFHGPNVVASTTKSEFMKIGHAISFSTELLLAENEHPTLDDVKRFWEMERAFNELTKGRLHVEIEEINENFITSQTPTPEEYERRRSTDQAVKYGGITNRTRD